MTGAVFKLLQKAAEQLDISFVILTYQVRVTLHLGRLFSQQSAQLPGRRSVTDGAQKVAQFFGPIPAGVA